MGDLDYHDYTGSYDNCGSIGTMKKINVIPYISAIPRHNPPPSLVHPLVLVRFCREAANIFGLLKILNILDHILIFSHSSEKTPPPCFEGF